MRNNSRKDFMCSFCAHFRFAGIGKSTFIILLHPVIYCVRPVDAIFRQYCGQDFPHRQYSCRRSDGETDGGYSAGSNSGFFPGNGAGNRNNVRIYGHVGQIDTGCLYRSKGRFHPGLFERSPQSNEKLSFTTGGRSSRFKGAVAAIGGKETRQSDADCRDPKRI